MKKSIFKEKLYHLVLTSSKLTFHKWEEIKHQLSIMKKHRNPSVLVVLWGYTSVLGCCIKVIVICMSLFQNCAVISDLVGEAMLILSFEAITTACLMFLFANIPFVVTHGNIFIITMVLSFTFRIHDKTYAMIAW